MTRRLLAVASAALITSCWTIQPTGAAYGAPSEIRVSTSAAADQITPLVVSAFLDHQLPVTSSQGGIIEAKLPMKMGLAARYEITARAIVVPQASGATVRLYAEETSFGNSLGDGTHRVTPVSSGRALETWQSLIAAAKQVQPDSTKIHIIAAGDAP